MKKEITICDSCGTTVYRAVRWNIHWHVPEEGVNPYLCNTDLCISCHEKLRDIIKKAWKNLSLEKSWIS